MGELIFSQWSVKDKPVQIWEVLRGEELVGEITFPAKREGKFIEFVDADTKLEQSELAQVVDFMRKTDKIKRG